jgi:hypothetical protein
VHPGTRCDRDVNAFTHGLRKENAYAYKNYGNEFRS